MSPARIHGIGGSQQAEIDGELVGDIRRQGLYFDRVDHLREACAVFTRALGLALEVQGHGRMNAL